MYEIYWVKLPKSSQSLPVLLLKDHRIIEGTEYCIEPIVNHELFIAHAVLVSEVKIYGEISLL